MRATCRFCFTLADEAHSLDLFCLILFGLVRFSPLCWVRFVRSNLPPRYALSGGRRKGWGFSQGYVNRVVEAGPKSTTIQPS